ncbi:MAG: hypothetical protein K8M05_20155 [Deltaproteobacteria bacterium]|nr:hypothetical protein [Kofleriaceae bacterium]
MRLVLALALALVACKKPEPARDLPVDAAELLRQRPQEVAHVTLKVLGMT